MSDEIIGIAILDTSVQPHKLHYIARPSGEKPQAGIIPVYPAGSPKPCDPAWSYEIRGDTLHCSPSVWERYQIPPDQTWHTRFHNGGQWSVSFLVARPVADVSYGYRQLCDANPELLPIFADE